MAPIWRVLRLVTLLVSVCPNVNAQTSVTAVWQLGPVPASLEASVITSYTTVSGVGTTGVVTYSAACPTAISPENDACRALNIYPVEVYHTQGSVWGGTITVRAESQTTTWVCSLGGCGSCSDSEARCTETIVEGGSTRTTGRNMTETCGLVYSSVPLVITAGVEKLQSYSWKGMLTDAAGYISAWNEELSSAGCPARQTLSLASVSVTASPSTTTSSSVVNTGVTTSARVASTGTSAAALPTSSTSAASRKVIEHVGSLIGLVWVILEIC